MTLILRYSVASLLTNPFCFAKDLGSSRELAKVKGLPCGSPFTLEGPLG
jgi:hypothetical protein